MSRFCSVILLVLAAGLVSCGDDPGDGDQRPLVVVTTTVLGDLLSNLVGDDVRLDVLVPIGADTHEFQASAAQAARVHQAELVFANGLGLEAGLADLLEAAGGDGVRVVELGPLLDPIPLVSAEEEDHGGLDPHVWLDPVRMADAARLIAGELAEIEPDVDWMGRADAYAAELLAADEEIKERLSVVPEESRIMVTNHDSLGYFSDRYGFRVVGVVIPGGSTLADPSSAHLAELVEVMSNENVRVIFGETTEPEALASAVASDLGEDVRIVELFVESLGDPGSGADSLIGMLETNAARISEALAPAR